MCLHGSHFPVSFKLITRLNNLVPLTWTPFTVMFTMPFTGNPTMVVKSYGSHIVTTNLIHILTTVVGDPALRLSSWGRELYGMSYTAVSLVGRSSVFDINALAGVFMWYCFNCHHYQIIRKRISIVKYWGTKVYGKIKSMGRYNVIISGVKLDYKY